MKRTLLRLSAAMTLIFGFSYAATAQSSDSLESRINRIVARPEFARSNFGIEFMDVATGEVLYALSSDKFFVPASTTKLLSEGTLLATLGPDFRFHTRIYRTGPIDKHGTLKGDLILVASGDPNLSNRIGSGDTLSFAAEDHSYNGPAVPGDPLRVIKELAGQIAAHGIRKLEGNIHVDSSFFPDGAREGGTDVVMSSIIVNDNLIDFLAGPGANPGDPVQLTVSPQTSYLHFTNRISTGAHESATAVDATDPVAESDGSLNVILSGSIPVGRAPQTNSYAVPSPTRFAATVFREALLAAGIAIKPKSSVGHFDLESCKKFYTPDSVVAEHVSPPLSEEIKVTLKTSQNLHAGIVPYLLGLLVAKSTKDPLNAGFKVERAFLEGAKLDLSAASQGDGAGGDFADLFTPDFICRYLRYWHTRPEFSVFFKALPVLGKDGTLAEIQVENSSAGHVFAKTGTFSSDDKLNSRVALNGKGLAGYVITKSGRTIAFAAYMNHMLPRDGSAPAKTVAGQALGEIAASAYDAPLP
jgi:PBP4 family serine-type D-alanyl-D-alanine carboxypeptidase